MQLFLFLFPLQHIKRPALQNKQVAVLRMAFRARKVLGTFEKRAPAPKIISQTRDKMGLSAIFSQTKERVKPTRDLFTGFVLQLFAQSVVCRTNLCNFSANSFCLPLLRMVSNPSSVSEICESTGLRETASSLFSSLDVLMKYLAM